MALQQRGDLRRGQAAQRQQHHHRAGRHPPAAAQQAADLLGFPAGTVGEHADRAHTDHDLAGRMDERSNLDPTPGEAVVNASATWRSHAQIRAELLDRRLAGG